MIEAAIPDKQADKIVAGRALADLGRCDDAKKFLGMHMKEKDWDDDDIRRNLYGGPCALPPKE